MRRPLLWLIAASLSMALTALAFCPAAWLGYLVEKQSGGRLTLGDAQGTLWRGSAFVGASAGKDDPVSPLLPGRFSWRLSPLVLLGQVRLELDNPSALLQPVTVDGSWSQWQVGASAVELPAERLSALGAPLNTIQPAGRMVLSWGPLQVTRARTVLGIEGNMDLALRDISSRLSPVKPLGAYTLNMVWSGTEAQLLLKTMNGPMLLSGSGTLANGQLHFSGKAEAALGQEQRLANLLDLLGQRQREGDHDVFALKL
ncbi:MAG: type II secretion system protein N [Burkholderiaceae bacterium]|nr:type II secretion system protein N [Burkholderiaceae bacterium]